MLSFRFPILAHMNNNDERSRKICTAIGKAVLKLLDGQSNFSQTELAELLEEWSKKENDSYLSGVYSAAAEFIRSGTLP